MTVQYLLAFLHRLAGAEAGLEPTTLVRVDARHPPQVAGIVGHDRSRLGVRVLYKEAADDVVAIAEAAWFYRVRQQQ